MAAFPPYSGTNATTVTLWAPTTGTTGSTAYYDNHPPPTPPSYLRLCASFRRLCKKMAETFQRIADAIARIWPVRDWELEERLEEFRKAAARAEFAELERRRAMMLAWRTPRPVPRAAAQPPPMRPAWTCSLRAWS